MLNMLKRTNFINKILHIGYINKKHIHTTHRKNEYRLFISFVIFVFSIYRNLEKILLTQKGLIILFILGLVTRYCFILQIFVFIIQNYLF